MKTHVRYTFPFLIIFLLSKPIYATPISYEFSGTVVASWGELTYLQLESVFGIFYYDTGWPAYTESQDVAVYTPQTIDYGIVLNVENTTFDSRVDNPAADHYLFLYNNTQPFDNGQIQDVFSYYTVGTRNYQISLSAITNLPEIPDALTAIDIDQQLALEDFNRAFGTFQIRTEDGNAERGRIYFSISHIAMVPEPATLGLLVFGLVGLGIHGRSRKS